MDNPFATRTPEELCLGVTLINEIPRWMTSEERQQCAATPDQEGSCTLSDPLPCAERRLGAAVMTVAAATIFGQVVGRRWYSPEHKPNTLNHEQKLDDQESVLDDQESMPTDQGSMPADQESLPALSSLPSDDSSDDDSMPRLLDAPLFDQQAYCRRIAIEAIKNFRPRPRDRIDAFLTRWLKFERHQRASGISEEGFARNAPIMLRRALRWSSERKQQLTAPYRGRRDAEVYQQLLVRIRALGHLQERPAGRHLRGMDAETYAEVRSALNPGERVSVNPGTWSDSDEGSQENATILVINRKEEEPLTDSDNSEELTEEWIQELFGRYNKSRSNTAEPPPPQRPPTIVRDSGSTSSSDVPPSMLSNSVLKSSYEIKGRYVR